MTVSDRIIKVLTLDILFAYSLSSLFPLPPLSLSHSVTAVFTDGRFGMTPNTSLFLNFSCSNNLATSSLSDCDLFDSCQSKCQYPLGLRCYGKYKAPYLLKNAFEIVFLQILPTVVREMYV